MNENVKKAFIKAGWYPNRNVKNRYSKVKELKKLPETIRNFLFEYGDLILEPNKNHYLDEYDFSVRVLKNKRIIFDDLCDVVLYKVGDWLQENTLILCDENLVLYIYDEELIKLGDFLEDGLQRLLEMNFKNQLIWDFYNKEWITFD